MAEDIPIPFTAREERDADPDRLLTFTDGVFAIIITILVLELEVPDLGSGQSLRESLVEIRPTFIAFVISFFLVGMYWVWHRGSFAKVRYVDRNAIWLNLLFLLPVSMIPFAASVLGEYSREPTALHLYGAVLIAATLFRTVVDSYLHRHPGLLWQTPSKQARRLSAAAAAAPLVVYVAAMLVADWLPWLSLLLYFSMPLLYFGFVAFLRADPRTKSAAEDLP
jgi:uncharacterized membrane protein